MKKLHIIILFILIAQLCYAQEKSQTSPIDFNGKTVNSFSITLPQTESFISPLFNSFFELNNIEKNPIISSNFNSYFQISIPKITDGQLDFYYNLYEQKNNNQTLVTIIVLVSKGYDNFISKNSDDVIATKILEALDEIGIAVKRKNVEIEISDKEQLMQTEKQKLLFIEQEFKTIENQKIEIDSKLFTILETLKKQSKITQDIGNELQTLRTNLSEFEKHMKNKSKKTLKVISKQ